MHVFEIATSSYASATSSVIVAQGATSGKTVQITLPTLTSTSSVLYSGPTTQNVLRTTLSFSSSPLGATTGRSKASSDALASLVFTPGNGGSAALNIVRVTFTGSAVTSTSFTTTSTYLLVGTPSSFTTQFPATLSTTTQPGGGSCVAGSASCQVVDTWYLPSGVVSTSNGLNVTGPTTLTLVANTANTVTAGSNNSVSLYANVQALSDIQYTDGVSGSTTSGLGLPSSVLVPVQLIGVQFATNS